MTERRKQFLISYQDENYDKKYLELVEKTQKQGALFGLGFCMFLKGFLV